MYCRKLEIVMRSLRVISNLVFSLLILLLGFVGYTQTPHDSIIKPDQSKKVKLNGNDGPYIINNTLYRVNSNNEVVKKKRFNADSLVVSVANLDANEFSVSLNSNYSIPQSAYELPEKMVVIADIEGKYNAFASFLFSNGIIDENHNWIFEKGHLVLVGDFVDRGKNVTQVLWLIYKLENQALLAGGQVHFILGNHEILNFKGDHRYNRGKYIKIAQEISGEEDTKKAIKYLYSDKSELGEWLATKNVVEKIGDYLFVHAGLSPELLEHDISLDQINTLVRSQYRGTAKTDLKKVVFLYGSKGPFWYRGLVMNGRKYSKIKTEELDAILGYYKSKKIIIGHTIVDDISTDFDGKVIRIDVSHGINKYSNKTKGLLIENAKEFVIDANGNKRPL